MLCEGQSWTLTGAPVAQLPAAGLLAAAQTWLLLAPCEDFGVVGRPASCLDEHCSYRDAVVVVGVAVMGLQSEGEDDHRGSGGVIHEPPTLGEAAGEEAAGDSGMESHFRI